MANGSARFDWVSQTPHGKQIPLEVTLTRIEWSGRQVIQALISDISERKKAETELRASETRLRESEARFSAAFRASPVFITISRMNDGRYVLVNEAFLKWTGYRLEEVISHNSQELSLWADPAARERLGRAAYEGVRAHYTIAHSAERLTGVYESLTTTASTRASKGAVLRDSA